MSESEKNQLKSIRMIVRGQANRGAKKLEFNVQAEVENIIRIENEKRFFDESFAHVVARRGEYLESLQLFDSASNLIASVICAEVEVDKKNTSLDKVESARVFTRNVLIDEKMQSEVDDTIVRAWKYRKDERRNAFINQLKICINQLDDSLIALKQVSTLSQEEIDLNAKIVSQRAELKSMREEMKKMKTAKKAKKLETAS